MARRRQVGDADGVIRPDFGDGGLKPDPMRSLEEQARIHTETAANTSSPVIREKRLAAADAAFRMYLEIQSGPQSTRVDCTLDDSGPYPTEREVEEMNAPGEDISGPEELPAARCARGLHQQAEREPWKCQHCAADDVNHPDATKLVLVLCPWLVAERSDPHNWVLKQRRKVESGANAGRYGWRDCGYYGTPGQAATKAMHLIAEGGSGVGGVEFFVFVQLLVQTEEKLRGPVQRVATSEAWAAALAEACGVVRGEEDRERIQKLMGRS